MKRICLSIEEGETSSSGERMILASCAKTALAFFVC